MLSPLISLELYFMFCQLKASLLKTNPSKPLKSTPYHEIFCAAEDGGSTYGLLRAKADRAGRGESFESVAWKSRLSS